MSKGMTTCNVCGRDFALIAEDHYISIAESKTGLAAFAGGDEPAMHDAMDCPHCGCQNILGKRERPYIHEVEACRANEIYEEEEKDVG